MGALIYPVRNPAVLSRPQEEASEGRGWDFMERTEAAADGANRSPIIMISPLRLGVRHMNEEAIFLAGTT